MQETYLFDDFPENSAKAWKQQIQFDLKGADYNEKLVWESPEGIKVKPFYEVNDLPAAVADNTTIAPNWKIGQILHVSNAVAANKKALELIENGVDSLRFSIPNEGIRIASLLRGIDMNQTAVHFELDFLSYDYVVALTAFCKGAEDPIFLNTDLIGNLAQSGNWHFNYQKDHEILTNYFGLNRAALFSVNASLYQNAGANMVQQLAFAMAQANEYLNYLEQVEGATEKFRKFTFQVAIGGNYFFEIAKLRALRILWSALSNAYGLSEACHITARPTKRNKTLYEYNMNMLRTTTECMAAILGGANTIFNLPYDSIYHENNTFGDRIALNQLRLLREESYFDQMQNAAQGAFYIESLTSQLAEKALRLFKSIEKNGGFLHQLKNHTIQKKIKESATKEQGLFEKKQLILVGTNNYQNSADQMKNDIEQYPFVKTNIRKTLIEPIIEKRLSEAHEQERLKKE